MSPVTEYMLQTALTLLGILLLGGVLLYGSRRWERALPKGPLELVGSLRLESRRSVYLVRVAQRVLVLGASEGGIEKLAELSPEELADSIDRMPKRTFSDLLNLRRTPTANAAKVSSPAAAAIAEDEA